MDVTVENPAPVVKVPTPATPREIELKLIEETRLRVEKDLKQHKIVSKIENGLFRYYKCRNPSNSIFWFNIVTWPGYFAIVGDMGEYIFSRTDDMIKFMRGNVTKGCISWSYILEKCVASGREKKTEFNKDIALAILRDVENEQIRELDEDHGYLDQVICLEALKELQTIQDKQIQELQKKYNNSEASQSALADYHDYHNDQIESLKTSYAPDAEELQDKVNDLKEKLDKIRRVCDDHKHVVYQTMYDSELWNGGELPDCSTYTFPFIWNIYAIQWFFHQIDVIGDSQQNLAYELFELRNKLKLTGSPETDWLLAEDILKGKYSKNVDRYCTDWEHSKISQQMELYKYKALAAHLPIWTVYSNEASGWWGPNNSGYFVDSASAGRYTLEQAIENCQKRSWPKGARKPEMFDVAPEFQ